MSVWRTEVRRIGFNAFGDIDPYIDWTIQRRLRRRPYAVQPATNWFPVMLLLRQGLVPREFASGSFLPAGQKPADWDANVSVPAASLDVGPNTYFTAFVRAEFFVYFDPSGEDLASELRQAILRMTVSRALREGVHVNAPGPGAAPEAPGAAPPEAGTVVVGVLDDGIAFANARFRTASGQSRVEHVWLQDCAANTAARRYGYGRVHSRADIDAAIVANTHNGWLDEDQVYETLGAKAFGKGGAEVVRTVGMRSSHGTHMMDLACGYRPGTAPGTGTVGNGHPDHRPIICVQLPAATDEGTSGASLDTSVVDGIRFILEKADQIAQARGCGRLPVVINFSYGTSAGRMDGTSDLERAIDQIVTVRSRAGGAPVRVVLPAGNSRLARTRAEVTFATADEAQTLAWQVLPDDRTATHMEIWLPKSIGRPPASRVTLSVQPPNGPASPAVGEQVSPVHVYGVARTVGICEVRYAYVPAPTNRGMFLVTLQPSADEDGPGHSGVGNPLAPSGVWKVTLTNASLTPDDKVDLRIQRDDTHFGYMPFGRQSYFVDPAYVRVDEDDAYHVPGNDHPACKVKRAGTFNAFATGAYPIVIGGFRRSDFKPTDYSGEGPLQSPHRDGPDALAPSDDSEVMRGILAAGNHSGSVVAISGTSVAAPQVARMIADYLADGIDFDRNGLAIAARSEEDSNADRRPERPAVERGGHGRLNRPSTGVEVLRRGDEPGPSAPVVPPAPPLIG